MLQTWHFFSPSTKAGYLVYMPQGTTLTSLLSVAADALRYTRLSYAQGLIFSIGLAKEASR